MLIDVHCHLDMMKNPEEAISQAKKAGVGIIVSNGVKFESNRKILHFASQFKEVKAALGIYPTDALKMSDSGIDKEIEFIKKNNEEIVAIGEVGLDLKESSDMKNQEENFLKFINLAKELGRPIIVHSRNAEERCIQILENEMIEKVIMHCFCGTSLLVRRIVENSWFLSIPTSVCYKEWFQQVIRETPIENLLCETDSPYLHPERKGENSPANVLLVYKKIAEIKNLDLRIIEKKIENNYNSLFS